MSIFIIRHAHAGDRHQWDGDDELRPLTDKGRAQADALLPLFDDVEAMDLYSSPYVRCMQTLEPLAAHWGRSVGSHPALAEGSAVADTVALARSLTRTGGVLCSHGDVIPDLIRDLTRDGMAIIGSRGCEKGSVWHLEVSGTDIVRGRYLAPPC